MFEVLIDVLMHPQVLWDITQSRLVIADVSKGAVSPSSCSNNPRRVNRVTVQFKSAVIRFCSQ